ncbi:hypothetical protein KUTeg_008405 [Tegillarca granosa]|uniref:Uncharacterized protein n=1 Tax=Tegillarca granosa TaxID=220873 RepID=A0ABQ9F936_TEGGR|nr:hypothetical protein KUTeg_008405 [Tegillarca granosa]
MAGSIYVSDPAIWRKFYKNMLDGKFRPEQYRPKQTGGGGIAGMYADQPYMIPVNPHAEDKEEEKIIVGKQVTPVAASLERASSEYKRQVEEGHPIVSLNQAGSGDTKLLPIPPKI